MPLFKQGYAVRTKGGGPIMTVDGYNPSGEVICTYFIKNKRQQELFVEATLELVSPDKVKPKSSAIWLGKERH
jgi:uncharacterized protein YodC (DUF2158 family)